MELIPRITSLFIEGLKPISDATRELIAKKFKSAVGLNIGMSPASVSYTHLDVYKRQPSDRT